eukprot:SAG11_NODE_1822_length_4207_cov_1.736125_9_plen_42_part_00
MYLLLNLGSLVDLVDLNLDLRVWMNIIRPILYGKWVPGTGT